MRRLMAALIACVFLFGLAPGCISQNVAPPELRDAVQQVDAEAAAAFSKDHLGSVTVGIVSGANLIWTKSYGYADMEKKIPADRDSLSHRFYHQAIHRTDAAPIGGAG